MATVSVELEWDVVESRVWIDPKQPVECTQCKADILMCTCDVERDLQRYARQNTELVKRTLVLSPRGSNERLAEVFIENEQVVAYVYLGKDTQVNMANSPAIMDYVRLINKSATDWFKEFNISAKFYSNISGFTFWYSGPSYVKSNQILRKLLA